MPLTTKQVKDRGLLILAQADTGIRWTDWWKKISSESPDTSTNAIAGALRSLINEREGKEIVKISRGVYKFENNEEQSAAYDPEQKPETSTPKDSAKDETIVHEESFYEPFAEWLKDELGEVIDAEALGGNILEGMWGTPDVLGVLKPINSDPIKFAPEIVSVEIKIDPRQPVVAFGQAIAYRLFSHKAYIVMPDTITLDDLERLKALSIVHGLGFVTFSLNPKDPQFKLQVRAQSIKPDVFYMNLMVKRVRERLPKIYDKIF